MKRKWFGVVLLGLGTFLLVAGVVALVWAPGVVKKVPLDVNQTTHLDGTVKKLDPATGAFEEQPVKIWNLTQTDSEASDDNTAVWVTKTCVVIDENDPPDCVDGDDPRLVTATIDTFASDRTDALAVPDFSGLPPGSVPHEGLVNKWPFDTEKKDYPYWDGTLEKSVNAVYSGTETILGIDTYKYVITTTGEPIEIAKGIDGTYDNAITIYVEPRTGAIQQQIQSQQRFLDDGTQVLDLNVQFTDETMQQFADDAKANTQLLDVMLVYVPVIGFVGGGLCLIAGILLLVSARRRQASGDAPAAPQEQEQTPSPV